MKSGLRKRETYNELIHDLEIDPIKHYPNRQATQTENSNYMSQLEGGFHDMMQQNERVMKEKQKDVLLHQMAASGGTSYHHLKMSQGSNFGSVKGENDNDSPFWADGMSNDATSHHGHSSYAGSSFLHSRAPSLSGAVQADLNQAQWQHLVDPQNDRPLMNAVIPLFDQPQQLALSSSTLHTPPRQGPHYHSIADDTADPAAIELQQQMLQDEYDHQAIVLHNRQMFNERLRVAGQMTQVTQADEILNRPSTVKIEEVFSGGASSSAAAAGPEDEHEKRGGRGRPKSVQPKSKASSSTGPEDTHEFIPSRASRAKSSNPRGLAQPVEEPDISFKKRVLKSAKSWRKYDITELRAQLKLRKSPNYKSAATNTMDADQIINVLITLDFGKTGV